MAGDLVERVQEINGRDIEGFRRQAREEAEAVKRELEEGTFDNHRSTIGLEYEFYAVTDGRWEGESDGDGGKLTRVPRRLLDLIRFERELGLHNAELRTSPTPLNAAGLRAQAADVRAHVRSALRTTSAEGMRLVSDGMWTIPPIGETAGKYLTSSAEEGGVRIATNMTADARYHAMSNGPNAPVPFTIDGPCLDFEADTVMPGSLTTSIQPHYQVAHADDLPTHHNYALRIAGPLLALAVNSPFVPPDLYGTGASPVTVARSTPSENRIYVFESVANAASAEKVRFPRDLETVTEAVDRIAEDPTIIPVPVERGVQFDDAFATFSAKHGSFWRWIRPVFGGRDRSTANARIEFRPLPAQPTVRDSVAFLAAFAGLMHTLPRVDHPVIDQDWSVAKANFYAAARNGLTSEQRWITTAGVETTETDVLYDDLLSHAADGLRSVGCTAETATRCIAPLRSRVETGLTPARWKRTAVGERVATGESLDTAIEAMQRQYIAAQDGTLLDGAFSDWPVPDTSVATTT
jgi:gamma-glutamyl:cysteine ligase YbdK (ATP-grasp superfamily)